MGGLLGRGRLLKQQESQRQGMGKDRRPVINVSWDDARDYVEWLSRHTGKTYRLLTEAEWEYAARASTTTNYAFGDTITSEQARFSEGTMYSAGTTAEVGSFPANRFRFHDMHGNVGEWVEDCWNANYRGAPADGSAQATGTCDERVVRGGTWVTNQDEVSPLREPRRQTRRLSERLHRHPRCQSPFLDLLLTGLQPRHLHSAGGNRCIPARIQRHHLGIVLNDLMGGQQFQHGLAEVVGITPATVSDAGWRMA